MFLRLLLLLLWRLNRLDQPDHGRVLGHVLCGLAVAVENVRVGLCLAKLYDSLVLQEEGCVVERGVEFVVLCIHVSALGNQQLQRLHPPVAGRNVHLIRTRESGGEEEDRRRERRERRRM